MDSFFYFWFLYSLAFFYIVFFYVGYSRFKRKTERNFYLIEQGLPLTEERLPFKKSFKLFLRTFGKGCLLGFFISVVYIILSQIMIHLNF